MTQKGNAEEKLSFIRRNTSMFLNLKKLKKSKLKRVMCQMKTCKKKPKCY